MAQDYDLIIIGSGPGGYVAGIRAGQLGLKVAVVEQDPKFGGTCLHRGCIPTKALLHTADLLDQFRRAGDFGVKTAGAELQLDQAQAYKQKVVDKNAKGIDYLFKKYKVEGIHGRGHIAGEHRVAVEIDGVEQELESRQIMIATGSVPRDIPVARADGKRILNSDHILNIEAVPKSLAVLGAGAVGTEFASIFSSFGSQVTLIEMLPRLLPLEDEEVSAELQRAYRKRGIKALTGAALKGVEETESGLKLAVERGSKEEAIEVEKLLVAVGRAPVTEGLGLAELGVESEKGYVVVNELMQTTVPHIYAIGDVNQRSPWLAHVASAEGILAVEHMAGKKVWPLRYDNVPSVTFCDPEVASVGLTEAKAREQGYEVTVGKFPFSALGKALILGKSEGFVKIVRDTRYDEVLGVHIVGAHATDLIAEGGVARQLEATTEDLIHTIHAHPTLAEAMKEAAEAALGSAIHF